MPHRKRNAWLLTLIFGAAFLGAAWFMAHKIDRFNKARQFQHWHIEPIRGRIIRVPGFPLVTLADSEDAAGNFAVKLSLGEGDAARVQFIQVRKPPALNLPDLGIYEEWLRVLAINEVVRDEAGVQSAKPGSEHLMVVVRRTPEGFDPASWGSVRRTEWLFDYYDIRADGSLVTQSRRWPMSSDRYEKAFQTRAAAPDSAPRFKELAAIAPLQERTLEYLAALHVIPKLNVPKYKFTDTAFSPRVLGWTLPVCMLSGLGFTLALFFAVAMRGKPASTV